MNIFKIYIKINFTFFLLLILGHFVYASDLDVNGKAKVFENNGSLIYSYDNVQTTVEQKWNNENFALLSHDGKVLAYTLQELYKEPYLNGNREVKIFEYGNTLATIIDPNDKYENDIDTILFSPNDKYLMIVKTSSGAGDTAINICSLFTPYECTNIQNIMVDALKNKKIFSSGDNYPDLINLSKYSWNSDSTLNFETNLYTSNSNETWKIKPDGSDLKQVGGMNPMISPFSDLKTTDPDYVYVLQAKQQGWLQGYPDGTLKIDNPINRAEFTKILIRALDNKSEPETEITKHLITETSVPAGMKTVCPDVPANAWYSSVFYTAKQLGAIKGYPDENKPEDQWLCGPEKNINRAEALKIILEMGNLDEETVDHLTQYSDVTDPLEWYAPYTAFAKKNDLIRTKDDKIHPELPLTRREMIYLTLKVKEMMHSGWVIGI